MIWLAALDEMIAFGMLLVRQTAPLDDDSPAMLLKRARMFEKTSRAVRMAIALQMRIVNGEALPVPRKQSAARDRDELDRDDFEYETLIEREYERYPMFESFDELGDRSTREVVEEICTTLGLPFDPRLWVEDVAAEDPEIVAAFGDWTREVRAMKRRLAEPAGP
jgi:hypothetical protein